MADLTIPIIGLTTLAGYFFANRTETKTDTTVENFEKPNGDNIYTSNVVEEANKEILQKSLRNYKLAEDPATSGILPPLFNTYSAVGNDTVLQGTYDSNASALLFSENDQLNKRTNVLAQPQIEVKNRPMFNSILNKNEERQPFSSFGSANEAPETSYLTGLPIDKNHNNMVPFFGSNVKQNVETFNNQNLLDLHTGNTSTFRHKHEVESFYDTEPENIYGNPVFSAEVEMDRFIPSLYRQNEKVVDDIKVSASIAATIDNNIRPVYKDVNDLRPGNKPKESYDGRFIAGKRGDLRGIQSNFDKNRPDTYYEKGQDHLFTTTGEFIAPKVSEDFETNFKDTSRQDYNLEYYGGVGSDYQKAQQRIASIDNSDELMASLFQDPKRNNFENDYTRNLGSQSYRQTNDYGKQSLRAYETERGTEHDYGLNVGKSQYGVKTRFSDDVRETIKETTLQYDNSGNVKTGFNTGISSAYNQGITEMSAKTTHKENTIMNNYKGTMSKNEGMGYTVTKYDARTTNKETTADNEHTGHATYKVNNATVYSTYDNPEKVRNALHVENYAGNALYTTESVSRDNYKNAKINKVMEQLLQGERPSGPQKFKTSSGKASYGDIKCTNNMKLKEQLDKRDNLNPEFQQSIFTKEKLGKFSKLKCDNTRQDTVFADRLQPELVQSQHNGNPYSLYNKNVRK